jgi:hypothetical protein
VFATGAPTQRLSVDVTSNSHSYYEFLPSGGLFPPGESFTIHNDSNHTIHWAVLLANGARFKALEHVPATIKKQRDVDIDADYSSGSIIASDLYDYVSTPAQLFSGVLTGNSRADFSGTVTGTFETSTISRKAVHLPTYSQGSLSDVRSKKDREIILNALGSAPTTRNSGAFTITLTGGVYEPSLESLSDMQPSLDSAGQRDGVVRWTGHGSIVGPQYKIFSQRGADVASNGLWIFAIFLGIAGAGILESLQSIAENLLPSKSPDRVESERNPS